MTISVATPSAGPEGPQGIPGATGPAGATSLLAYAYADPATAGSKSVTGTTFSALDTTNLRVTFTAPGSGLVVVKFGCSVNGVTSNQSLLAILEASTVLGVVLGIGGALNNQYLIGSKLLTGLTAGSHSYDLALASSSSGTISAHWGGGINASGFGPAFVEIWG